jgi:FH1/FH2 domain-containing protein 3
MFDSLNRLLKDYDNADTELLIYATSLINKTLSGLSDQDSFYDESDFLEQQGMESIIQRYMSRTGTDLDLLDQFQLYEAALRFEDGESDAIIRLPDNTVRKTLRHRSSGSTERRKSRRHSTGTTVAPPVPPPIPTYSIAPPAVPPLPLAYMLQQQQQQTADNDSSSSGSGVGGDLNGFADCKVREGVAGVTPGLRRRRERAERQKSFQREQEAVVDGTANENNNNNNNNESDECGM